MEGGDLLSLSVSLKNILVMLLIARPIDRRAEEDKYLNNP